MFEVLLRNLGLDLPIEKFSLEVQFVVVLENRLINLFFGVTTGSDLIKFLIVLILLKVKLNAHLIAPEIS
jgi:hypothetical protein